MDDVVLARVEPHSRALTAAVDLDSFDSFCEKSAATDRATFSLPLTSLARRSAGTSREVVELHIGTTRLVA